MARLGNISSHQIANPALRSVFIDQSLPIELAKHGGLTLHLQGAALQALFAQHDPILAKALDNRARTIRDAMLIQESASNALTALTTGDPMYVSEVRSELRLNESVSDLLYDIFIDGADIDDLHDAFKRAETEEQEYALIEVFTELTRMTKIELDSKRQRAFDVEQNHVPCVISDTSLAVPLAHSPKGIVVDGEAYLALKREVGEFLARYAQPYLEATQACYLGPVAEVAALEVNLVPRSTRFWMALQQWRDCPVDRSEAEQWAQLKPYMIAWSVMARL